MTTKSILLLLATIVLIVNCARSKVLPHVNCIAKLPNRKGHCIVFWGYINKWKDPFGQIEILHGPNNKFHPLPTPRQGQPTKFIPGIHINVFQTVKKCSGVTQKWTVKGKMASTGNYRGEVHDDPSKCLSKCSTLKCEHSKKPTGPGTPKKSGFFFSGGKLSTCKQKCYSKCGIDCPKKPGDSGRDGWIRECKKKCDKKCNPPTCKQKCKKKCTHEDGCGECDGKVNSLTLQYNGNSTVNVQVCKCHGNTQCDEVYETVNGVQPGSNFTISRSPDFGPEICLNGLEIHTSCSKPIGIGSVFGDYTVSAGSSRNGGSFCTNGQTPHNGKHCEKKCEKKCKPPTCKQKCYKKCDGDCPKKGGERDGWIRQCRKKCDKKCTPTRCRIKDNSALSMIQLIKKHHGKKGPKRKTHVFSPIELPADVTPQDFYSYDDPDRDSVNSGIEDQFRDELQDRIWMVPMKHKQNNEVYMMIVGDVPKDGSGGQFSYKIRTDSHWPTQAKKDSYWPVTVHDDPNHAPDRINWDADTKTLNVTTKWFPCCTDGIVFGGIHGCFNLKFTSTPTGVADKTIALVEYRNNTRVVVDTGLYPREGLKLRFCPSCLGNGKGCHGGFKRCRSYDRCGTCNGDNSTCIEEPKKCTDCGKLKIFQKTKCLVKAVKDSKKNEFLLKAEGSYLPGKTRVNVTVKCKHKKDSDEINGKWQMRDAPCPNDPHGKFRRKTFFQKISLACLYRCYGSHNKKHSHESLLKGIISIKSFRSCRTRCENDCPKKHHGKHRKKWIGDCERKCRPHAKLIYSVPCKFNIHSKTCGIASIHFNIHHPTCDMKLLKQEWCPSKHPKNLIVKFVTSIKKPHGKKLYLADPEVVSHHGTEPLRVHFLPPKDPKCLRTSHKGKCTQMWSIRTSGGKRLKCFNGVVKLRFRLVSKCRKGKTCKRSYVKMTLVFKKLCKPTKPIHIHHKGFGIGIKGPFCDKRLRQGTDHLIAFHRAYFKVFLKGLPKDKCDEFKLAIKKARVCYPKDSDHYIDSCNDKFARRRTIWDFTKGNHFRGGDWHTRVHGLPDRHNCTSDVLLSFKALLFDRWEQNSDAILQVKGVWHHHMSHRHIPFTYSMKLSESAWSSKSYLRALPSIRKSDPAFASDLEKTYTLGGGGGGRHVCRRKDGCGKAWIVVRCPPHQVFKSARHCASFSCGHNHKHGKCVKRPFWVAIETLFTFWGAWIWFIICIWVVICIVALFTICACPGKMTKTKKCYSDECGDNHYHYCKKCDFNFGCSSKKYHKCTRCKEECSRKGRKQPKRKKKHDGNTYNFYGNTEIINRK